MQRGMDQEAGLMGDGRYGAKGDSLRGERNGCGVICGGMDQSVAAVC